MNIYYSPKPHRHALRARLGSRDNTPPSYANASLMAGITTDKPFRLFGSDLTRCGEYYI